MYPFHWPAPSHLHKPKAARGKNLYLQGIAIQLTNPKAALQWIAIVGIGLGNEAPLWVGLALILNATTLSLAVHVLYAVTFSTAPVIVAYQKARRWIEGSLGLFFSFAPYKIATYRQ
ncbi:MAG: amino acid exporter [Yoonia sp.]|jgi:amino acid exporter